MKNKTIKGIIFFSFTAISFLFIVLSMIINIARENKVSIKKRQYASLEQETRVLNSRLNKKMYEMNMEMSYSNIVSKAKEIGLAVPQNQYTVVRTNSGIYNQNPREKVAIMNFLNNLRFNQDAKASDNIR